MEYDKKCLNCSKDFKAPTRRARFCSTYCRVDFNRKKKRETPHFFPKQVKINKPTTIKSDNPLLQKIIKPKVEEEQVLPVTTVVEQIQEVKTEIKKFDYNILLGIAKSGLWNKSYEELPEYKRLTSAQHSMIKSKVK